MHFYLTINDRNREPSCTHRIGVIHVKARADGDQTIIVSPVVIASDACVEQTQESAQAILDSWIEEENKEVPFDCDGNPIIQSRVDLSLFVGRA